MADRLLGFDWDSGNREKCQKHGVSVAKIEDLFRSGRLTIRPDLAHSQAEERFQGIGRTQAGRAVFLVFAIRERDGRQLIRPISARYMHRKEIANYEEDNPSFATDEEAEQFVETADLSEYDLSGFKPATFEFQSKAAQLNMRVPQLLLDAVKRQAKAKGIPYTRFIRQLMEQAVSRTR